MALFFAATLFTSAFLLFLVQPMVGKMVLPLLGGTPAVWTTCMVVFQALLLAGYAYAHAATRRFGVRRQALTHLVVLALPLAALAAMVAVTGAPVAALRGLAPEGSDQPFFGVVTLLLVMIGVPFFVVSTSAPLLQSWFAATGHRHARDPYFLYAASNLGSMLALVAYPAVVEPALPLARQAWLWAGGYVVLAVLTVGCAVLLWRSSGPLPSLVPEYADPPVRTRDRLVWLALSFVPSSLLLGVTTYASTDIAPIPLLWVVPLGLYLATFVVAFGRTPASVARAIEIAAPVFILLLLFWQVSPVKPSLTVNLAIQFLGLFIVSLFCHLELARRRPAAGRLTEFFLWVSVGGVLGGLFNALVAPVAFTGYLEYPLTLIAAAFLLPAGGKTTNDRRANVLDAILPVVVAGLTLALVKLPVAEWLARGGTASDAAANSVWLLRFGLPALVCLTFVGRPVRFGAGLLAVWGVGVLAVSPPGVIHQDRSFFGVLRVEQVRKDGEVAHKLVHGVTSHGMQVVEPRSTEPLTYFHRTGPAGQAFAALTGPGRPKEVAVIGLGTGSLASYAHPGSRWTYYEIDPPVRRVAENPAYFTFLRDTKAATIDVVMGDARLKLEGTRPGQFGLLVVDAFSSDAIPVHLLTKEAVQLYLDKLTPDGAILMHISNRYLSLEPVVARIAEEMGLAGVARQDTDTRPAHKHGSRWVVLARRREHLGTLTDQVTAGDSSGWRELSAPPGTPLWTDDYSNLLQIFNWR